MGKKVLITGATGFVGRYLLEYLSLGDCELFGTSFPESVEDSGEKEKYNLFHVDIRSEKDLTAVIEDIDPDWIFHLAAVSNVGHSWTKRKETMETNLMGTFFLFEAVRNIVPEARVLFISSSDVYGILEPVEEALSEKTDVKIVNPYAFTKVSGEFLSRFYAEIEGLDILIARPFPHTGPGQSEEFVCSDWACQIARIEKGLMEPVIQVGNLEIRRDFSDVRDVVWAYALLMEKGKKGEVFNVCSGRAVSLDSILKTLLSFSEKKIDVRVDPNKLRKADIPLLLGDNSKLTQTLNWSPKIPLDQTLKELLDYWRERI